MMLPHNNFNQLVQLYRRLNRPAFTDKKFQVDVNYTLEIEALIKELWQSNQFEITLSQGGRDTSTEDQVPFPSLTINELINIEVKVPHTEKAFFYQNTEQWIELAPSLRKGKISSNVYLIDEDVIVNDNHSHPKVCMVQKICERLIK